MPASIALTSVPQVLIVDDDRLQREMLGTLLQRKLEYASLQAEHGRAALDVLRGPKGQGIQIVILDLDMPVMSGIETLEILQQNYPTLPVIMLTGSRDLESAIQAMKLGAQDFLTKPFEPERMLVSIQNALKMSALSREVMRLRHTNDGTFGFSDLIGHDGGLQQTVHIARKAAASDIAVLLTGETGVGKEVFARAIHGESTRAGRSFIAVNCGAIPSQLVESTLFGHEKGAFTGAVEKAIGKFREADGGTIFLDEVGELPLEAQVKLLRILQQKEVEPVGAARAIPVNLRVISATNRDLEADVKSGRFREDLYFRLNVLEISIPPLRARMQDMPELTKHFINRFCAQHNKASYHCSAEALAYLAQQNWPGNVRQLENSLSRAMVLADGAVLDAGIFQTVLQKPDILSEQSVNQPHANILNLLDASGDFKSIEQLEQEIMRRALAHYNGNITQAAAAINMAKSTFYRKLQT
jgi:DNA-binding NtrC family response regulator